MKRILVFLVAGMAFAQEDRPYRISGGFKIGGPVDHPAKSSFVTGTILTESRWTGGPTADFSLPASFAIGFEALYRNRQEDFGGIANLFTGLSPFQVNSRRNTNSWDLPLLLKLAGGSGAAVFDGRVSMVA